MTELRAQDLALDADDTSADHIRRAEAAIAGLKANFAVWVKADIDTIAIHLGAATIAKCASERAAKLEDLRRIAHNIKGQGGTFGCHELSAAAAALDGLLKSRTAPPSLDVVAAMVANLNSAYLRELC